ncbi:MAG: VirB4 family type IV secretion system protein [Acidimicrobiales bacterium]
MRPPPAHRATTAHLQALYPFVSGGGLGGGGPIVGRDLLGGIFCFDPWDLYRRGVLTNPNVIVLGQLGRGKSTFVKTMVWRHAAFGRRSWIVDPKGEYGALARACGSEAIRLEPGGPVRLNPLELPGGTTGSGGAVSAGSPADRASAVRRRSRLTSSLVASSLGRALAPAERTAIDLAIVAVSRAASQPTLPEVVEALLEPDPALAATVRTDADGLARDGRAAALELRRLVDGDLAGIFDGPTSRGLDLDAPVVVLDLSAVFASPALALLMTCATSWLQALLSRPDGPRRLVVVDEAWAVLHDLATARWLQSTFKLARAFGVCNLAVVHRLSDLQAAGGEGSAQQRLAEGLLADSETRVVFGQSPAEAGSTGRMLGLTGPERDLVARLPRGVALWKVGERSFLVEHQVGGLEAALVDTDAAMTPGAKGAP